MSGNLGKTTLKRSGKTRNPMKEFDELPFELRQWVREAALPWRAVSVRRAYLKALRRGGDPREAMRALDEAQRKLVAKDASRIWGRDHPDAA